MILIGFALNLANLRKILWWLCCYAWWLDEFLGNFSSEAPKFCVAALNPNATSSNISQR
jgi:hypothetical protein